MGSQEKQIKLSLKNISKSFYSRKEIFEAVNDISLEVYKNEFLVLLGPGQCGKSVLLNIVSGLEKATVGEVAFPEGNGICFPEDSSFSLEDSYGKCRIPIGSKKSPQKRKKRKSPIFH